MSAAFSTLPGGSGALIGAAGIQAGASPATRENMFVGPLAGPPNGGRSSGRRSGRSEEHTSELQSLMRISYAVFCLKKKTHNKKTHTYLNNLLIQQQYNHQ